MEIKKTCVICGKTFTPLNNKHKTCSVLCAKVNRSIYLYEQQINRFSDGSPVQSEDNITAHQGVCVVCGRSFAYTGLRKHQPICSVDCTRNFFIDKYFGGTEFLSKGANVRIAKCIICGKEFSTSNSNAKTCSAECSHIRHCTSVQNWHANHTSVAEQTKTCEFCGVVFQTSYSHKKYCSRECSLQSAWNRKPDYKYNCLICGKEFSTKSKTQVCCSTECTQLNQQRIQSLQDIKSVPVYTHTCPICKKDFTTNYKIQKYCSDECIRQSRQSIPHDYLFTCPVCGKDFSANSKAQKYCSPECFRQSRRREQKVYTHTCPVCKKDFTTIYKIQKYCSDECIRQSRRRNPAVIPVPKTVQALKMNGLNPVRLPGAEVTSIQQEYRVKFTANFVFDFVAKNRDAYNVMYNAVLIKFPLFQRISNVRFDDRHIIYTCVFCGNIEVLSGTDCNVSDGSVLLSEFAKHLDANAVVQSYDFFDIIFERIR